MDANRPVQKEIPSLWQAAKREMDDYQFVGNYEQPKWDISPKIGISCAVSPRSSGEADRGHISTSIDRYIDEASSVIEAGAWMVHIDFTWVSDENGRRLDRIPPVEAYSMVLEPLRKRHGDSFVANLNVLNGSTFDECMSPIVEGLAEVCPCAPGHPEEFLEPAIRTMLANGALPNLAIHNSGEIELIKRRLLDTGLLKGPAMWALLFGLPFDVGRTLLSGNCVMDADDMVRQMMLMIHQIEKLQPGTPLLIVAAGRATLYMTTLATILGHHIHVGTEDTRFKYPNSDEEFKSNLDIFNHAKQIAELHGRTIATAAEMREVFGMSKPS